jgi:hypothetical protein
MVKPSRVREILAPALEFCMSRICFLAEFDLDIYLWQRHFLLPELGLLKKIFILKSKF